MPTRIPAFVLTVTLVLPVVAAGQTRAGSRLVPELPDTIVRAEDGSVTVLAVRLDEPIEVDGTLDEPIYERVRPASGFIQVEPDPGAPARDQTEFWIMFDDENVYMAARAWDSDMEIIAPEMRRDNLWSGNDIVGFAFDTFLDRRNSLSFHTSALGARHDGQSTNESQWNGDLNPVWRPAVGRFDGGWTLEAVIPFKSLRYAPGREQVWGLQVVRPSRSINEISFLTEMPPAQGQGAIQQMSLAATLVGIEAPSSSRIVELKPYLISNASQDVASATDDLAGDFGLDAKVGITEGLTADFTYNTDFAQVEADEAQVNLTRFSLFFPEKREFFLENAGTFSFGGVSVGGDAPTIFYSRRIGLEGGQEVPLRAGGRVTGRVGPFSLGVINIQTDEVTEAGVDGTNFSVVRLKRDILRRSAVGVLMTARSVAANGVGANYAYGLDGTFGFSDDVTINTYWARTESEGLSGDDVSYRAQFVYNDDRYGVQLDQLGVGAHFNPEIGFVRRRDMRRSFGELRFSPRPAGIESVRQFNWTASTTYIENGAGLVETREHAAAFQTEFVNDDSTTLTYTRSYEFLPVPFEIAPDVTVPVGAYGFDDVQLSYNMAQQRPIRANLSVSYGTFYSGHKTTWGASGGRVRISDQMSLQPGYTFNQVELAQGDFTTHLLSTRATYTMTPNSFVSALVQYSSRTNSISTNARLRWEYSPGSELFVVYNEQRDTFGDRFADLVNRAFIVKVNRLFRF